MDFTCIIFGVLFSIYGILFATGRMHIHLNAWKNMPEEEKNKIRIKPLCLNIGKMITGCGILFLAGGIWQEFKITCFQIGIIIWLAIAFLDVLYISKSGRYHRG